MATPIVDVTATNGKGIAVTEAANGKGTPVTIAANGFGTPVVYVASGGIPVVSNPVLSAPGADAISSAEILIFASTNQASGRLYAILTQVSALPTAAQVKAGQDSTGTPVASQNQAITSAGSKAFSFLGLTPSTTYYGFLMHENSSGLQSPVVATGAVVTDA